MRKKWTYLRILASMCAALGWWGLLYPELTLTPDTVKVSAVERSEALDAPSCRQNYDGNLYFDLLNADPRKITFRSKLLTNLSSFWEAIHDKDTNK